MGVHLDGHPSSRKLGAKPSFMIRLDRFENHRLAAKVRITLDNMIEDRSIMREVLAYRRYRALGVAVPSAGRRARADQQYRVGARQRAEQGAQPEYGQLRTSRRSGEVARAPPAARA